MGWFFINGIRVYMDDNADPADYAGLVNKATLDMRNYMDSWGNDKVFNVCRRGNAYTMRVIDGNPEIIMGEVPRKAPRYPALSKQPADPLAGYCPAFHTVDENNNLIGLTVCFGKWGNGYMFVPCRPENVKNFAYGWWNYERDWDERDKFPPPPEYFQETFVGNTMGRYDIFEIPAQHEYVGWKLNVYLYGGSILSGGTFFYSSRITPVTDWDRFWETYDYTQNPNIPFIIDRRYYSDYDTGAYDDCGSAITSRGQQLWMSPSASTLVTNSSNGQCDGFFAYGDINLRRFYGSYNENCHNPLVTHPLRVEWYDHSTCSDRMYFFGNEYVLREDLEENPTHAQSGINRATPMYAFATDGMEFFIPRLYEDKLNDSHIGLAAMGRKSETTIQYILMSDHIQQYNDPNATYEILYINPIRHELPIRVNGQDAFGNGQFSLVRINTIPEEV